MCVVNGKNELITKIGKLIGHTIYIIIMLVIMSAFIWLACWGFGVDWTLKLDVGVVSLAFLINFAFGGKK